jgi:hypothetical protein
LTGKKIIAQKTNMLNIGAVAYQNASSLQTNDNRLIRQAASRTSPTSQLASALDLVKPVNTGGMVSLSPEADVVRL